MVIVGWATGISGLTSMSGNVKPLLQFQDGR